MASSTARRLLSVAVALVVLGALAIFLRDPLRGARARSSYPRIIVVTLDTLHVDCFVGMEVNGAQAAEG